MSARYRVARAPGKTGSRGLLMTALFLASTLNFADRAIFSALAQTIKVDLRLTDLQLGLLQGLVFALLYAVAGLPIGRLAERRSRTGIIAVVTAIWSAATAATGLAASFLGVAFARLVVGLGEAGFTPTAASLVADIAPRARRASMVALVQLGSPAGAFVGATLAGIIAAAHDWRTAFVAFAVPGFLIAVLLGWIVAEPERGQSDDAAQPASDTVPSFGEFLGTLRRSAALRWVIAGGSLAGFGMTSISQFLAVFLARTFDLNVRDAATSFGAISGIALSIGLLMGSFGTDFLARRDPRWSAWGAALGLSLTPPLYWMAFSAPSLTVAFPLLLVAGAMLLIFYGPTTGMIQNLLPARMRATGVALFALFFTLIGSGLGPVFVGAMSDLFAAGSFVGYYGAACPRGLPPPGAVAAVAEACRDASAYGIRAALMLAISVMFVAALCFVRAAPGLRVDQTRA